MSTDNYQEIRLTGDRWALVNVLEGFALAFDDSGTSCRLTSNAIREHILNLEDGSTGWAISHWAWYYQDPPRLTILPYGPGLLWLKCRLSLEDLKLLDSALILDKGLD